MLCLRTEITISVYHCDYGLDLEFRSISANLTESATWFEGYISVISTSSVLWTLEVCQSQITPLPTCDCTPVACNGDVRCWTVQDPEFCVFSHLVDLPVVFVSPLHWCRAHTHLYISSRRTCVLICLATAIFLSLEWARLCHAKAACFHFMRCHRTVVD